MPNRSERRKNALKRTERMPASDCGIKVYRVKSMRLDSLIRVTFFLPEELYQSVCVRLLVWFALVLAIEGRLKNLSRISRGNEIVDAMNIDSAFHW